MLHVIFAYDLSTKDGVLICCGTYVSVAAPPVFHSSAITIDRLCIRYEIISTTEASYADRSPTILHCCRAARKKAQQAVA